jgi:hypothetical protein
MALTRKEVTRLAKLINVAGLEIKNVVLYHEDNSIFASINDGAKTWDLNMTHLTLAFVPFEPVASRNQRSISTVLICCKRTSAQRGSIQFLAYEVLLCSHTPFAGSSLPAIRSHRGSRWVRVGSAVPARAFA